MDSIDPQQLAPTLGLYARALQLEYGECRYLHYGVAQGTGEGDCLRRQQQFSEQLLTRLVASLADADIALLSGPSLGPIASALVGMGHQVDWLHASAAGRTSRNEAGVSHWETAEFQPGAERYGAILVEGSLRYPDQLGVLSGCRQVLRPGGRLLLFGEFLDDDSRIERSDLPNLSSCRQLAQRLGFALTDESDCSSGAEQSAQAMQQLLTKHEPALMQHRHPSVSPKDAVAALDAILEEFRSRRRSFRLFEFIYSPEERDHWVAAEYSGMGSFQPEELGELFQKSFGKAFDPALWHWKYVKGDGKCVVARERPGAAIISHYGGAPRQILYFGSRNMAIQVCDVMVMPERRRQYGKNSLFFKTAATFLEREIGNTVGHLLGFGFPNQKAMNIALRLGLYEKTDDFVELIPTQSANRAVGPINLVDVNPDNQDHVSGLEQLWIQMQGDFARGIIGIRDWDYFHYRYLAHPDAQSYRRLLLSADGESGWLACVVLKEHEQQLLLMDVICPVAAVANVIERLQLAVQAEGDPRPLRFWLTRGWMEAIRLNDATVNELGIEIPCNSWNPGPAAETLYGAWWLTAGDMDFM